MMITINVPVVFMVLRSATSLRGALEGVGPENRDFLGPEMARAKRLCLLGPSRVVVHLWPEEDTCRQDSLSNWIEKDISFDPPLFSLYSTFKAAIAAFKYMYYLYSIDTKNIEI